MWIRQTRSNQDVHTIAIASISDSTTRSGIRLGKLAYNNQSDHEIDKKMLKK